MALARKIDKAKFDALDPKIQFEYKLVGNSYILDTEGDDEAVETMRIAKDREVNQHNAAKRRITELEAEVETAMKSGDAAKIEAVETKWKKKYDTDIADRDTKLSAKDGIIKNGLLDRNAKELAAAISTSPNVMLPHIKARLTVDMEDGEPKLVVLNKDGKPSVATLDDLKKELVANKDFSAILIGSKGSGGGAPKPGPGSRATLNPQNLEQPVSLAAMTPENLAASITASKEAAKT